MKPNKNKPICADCGKPKMVFETEKKAQNFIKYNGNDILKENQTINDIRVYYCPSCCAYHISTKPFKENYNYRTEKLIESYKRYNTNKAVLSGLNISNEEIINTILKLVQKACITSKNQLKKQLNIFFAEHKDIPKKNEDAIRSTIYNIILNKTKKV